MKAGVFVVSSYEVEGGLIRVRQKSPANEKKTYTMDEAIAKLRRVLREMKEQDKTIYRQLMTLNSNITRLKSEINREEDKKKQYDNELEYDYESLDSDDSYSDFDLTDLEENDIEINELAHLSNLDATAAQEGDRDSIHERYDSGIQEDASYNLCQEGNTTSLVSEKPQQAHLSNRGTGKHAWNGERSSRYDFLLSTLSNSDESQIAEENASGRDEIVNRETSSHNASRHEILDQTDYQDQRIVRKEEGLVEHGENQSGKAKIGREKEEDEHKHRLDARPNENEEFVFHRSQTMRPRKTNPEPGKRFSMHRRSQSEDQIKFDINANITIDGRPYQAPLTARERYKKQNLGHISENGSSVVWNAFDARNYRNSEAETRRIVPILRKGSRSKQLPKLGEQNKTLNGSLTQLNLEGAISKQALKAIKRSVSVSNCSVFTIDNDGSGSFKLPKGDAVDRQISRKRAERLQKTASAFVGSFDEGEKYTSTFEVGYRTHPNGLVSSTISLV